MFPQKLPLLFVLHLLSIIGVIALAIVGGVFYLQQPAAMLSLLALQYVPEFPVVHDPASMDKEELDEAIGMGFGQG